MPNASRSLRWVEDTLWILGVVLLGAVLGEVAARWSYQTQQERALEQVPAPPPVTAPAMPSAPAVAAGEPEPQAARVKSVAPKRSLEKKERRRAVAVDPTAVGRIEIPRIGVAAFVRDGADEGTLSVAVGLVPGTARPGEAGNMVLAGHRDTFFRPLRKIRLNDRIRVVVPPHTYEYRVQSLRVVEPEETSVLASKGVEELTLVTCYPFRFIGSAPERFIVSAARVN